MEDSKKKKPCLALYGWWYTKVPPTWLVIVGALIVQLGFGLYPVIVKRFAAEGNDKADPLVFSFYRDSLCSPLLFVCALVAERKILIPRPKMLLVLMLLGFVGMFGNQLLYILGVYWAGPNIASAFQPIIPVWTAILALVTCTEKLPSPCWAHTWIKLLGIVLATGGAIELTVTGYDAPDIPLTNVTSNTTASPFNFSVMGYVALFGNTFCMAIYVLMQKRLIFNRLSCRWRDYPVSVTAYSYTFGAVFMGISTIYLAATGQSDHFILPANSWYALVYAVFITSALCYLLVTWSNMHLSATIVTAFWPTQVLVTVLASFIITGDVLKPLQYLGAVMLLVALVMVLIANHMDERVASGKAVLRLNACVKKGSQQVISNDRDSTIGINDEHTSLLKKSYDSKGYDESMDVMNSDVR